MIGPRIMNPLVSLESVTYPALDGGSSETYRRLVMTSLKPLKELTLGVICLPINRVFKFQQVRTRFWFDPKLRGELVYKEDEEIKTKVNTWVIRDSSTWAKDKDILGNRLFLFAVSSLQVSHFTVSIYLRRISVYLDHKIALLTHDNTILRLIPTTLNLSVSVRHY